MEINLAHIRYVAIVLTVYGIETSTNIFLLLVEMNDVAIVLTVYGIETSHL